MTIENTSPKTQEVMRHSSATIDLCLALEIESQERAKRLNICIIDSASQDKESHMRALS